MAASLLSKEDCEKILYKFAGASSQLQTIKITRMSEKVMGFLGEHYQLKLIYLVKNNSGSTNTKTTTFFMKTLPQDNDNHKQYVKTLGLFKKEMLVYKNLLSIFLKKSSAPFAGQFYFANEECIVFEDLRLKSFEVPTNDVLTEEQCKSALKSTAKFHAASLIFEESRSTSEHPYRIGDHFPEELRECTYSFVEGHPRNLWLINVTDCLSKLLKSLNGDESVTKKLHDFAFKEMPKFLEPSQKYRNVVTHDDLWRNNLMFNDKNECFLVDFQLARYTPPMFDILVFLYINLDWEYLKVNMTALLNYYYDEMESELKNHNLDPEQVFPRKPFFESVSSYQLPALIESALYGTTTFTPENITSKMMANIDLFKEFTFNNRASFLIQEYENNAKYRNRFNSVLIPLYELLKE